MTKLISKLRIIFFALFAVEAVGCLAVSIFWIFNLFGFRNLTENLFIYIVCCLAVFLVIDAIFYWFSIAHLRRVRQRNDEEAVSLIGSDIQEAYNFSKIGLIVIDEDNKIIWANNLFRDMLLDVIDMDAFTFLPGLMELVESPNGQTVKIDLKDRKYDVRYLSAPRLFVFKDVTEYENMAAYSKEQAIVLGLIIIDNFNDVASDTDESADIVSTVRGIITDYCRDFGVLLRRIKNDSYFAVCNFSSLAKMEKDRFSLLDKVRVAQRGEDVPLTLSIGFSHDFPDISKLNEMASDAISVALSRGGNQVVVSRYGHELAFYGGKSEAVEATSRVKVRSVADSVSTIIKQSSDVLIMGHSDMDMDALGSSLGMMAICDWCGKPSKIVYSPKKAEKKTRLAFQSAFSRDVYEKMVISPEDAVNQVKESTLVIIVDVSVPALTMAPKLLDVATKVLVIDHHRRGDKYPERPVLSYVEPSAASASELIVEMIRYATANPRIELKPSYATIMLSGIFMDSNYFKSNKTGMRTFEAAEILKSYGADNSVADDYLKEEFEEYTLVNKIVSTIKTPYYGVVYCVSDDHDIIERSTLAKVCNQLMQLKGINACFVIGRTDDKTVRMSARSDGSINVQTICEKMGGGGHFSMAATAMNGNSSDPLVKNLLSVLDNYLDSARTGQVDN